MPNIKTKIKKATSTRKGKIIALTILLGILGIVAAGIIYWNYHKKAIIREKLVNAIQKKSKGLYVLHYDDLELDEVAGNLTVKNFRLDFDSAKYLAMREKKDAPPILFHIAIPSISVTGVKTPRALLDKEIVGKKLQLSSPVIDIIYTYTGTDSLRNTPTREVYEQILGDLNLIKIDSLLITQAHITTKDIRNGKQKVRLENTNVLLTDVVIDSSASEDATRLLFSKKMEINCSSLHWKSANQRYNFKVDSIQVRSSSQDISVVRFRMDPGLDEASFVKSLPTQDDRFDFTIRNILLKGVNFPELLKEKILADSAIVKAASFYIYRDLAIPRDKKNRVGRYPHQALVKMPVSMKIKKMILANSFVEYKERSAKTRQAGKVQFYHAYTTISNLTNIKEAADNNNVMTVDISTSFLNRAPLRVTWLFYLFNPKGRFDVKGNLGAIDVQALNALTVPMGPARIEKGKINQLQFNLAGNDYAMTGDVKLLYEDLKVSILEKDEETKTLEKKKLASLAANIIIKNSNPAGAKDEAKTAHVQNDRDTNRSIFHLAWKTLFKGVKETVGINQSNKEQK